MILPISGLKVVVIISPERRTCKQRNFSQVRREIGFVLRYYAYKINLLGQIPSGREAEVQEIHAELYSTLLNGVYKAGIGLVRNKH